LQDSELPFSNTKPGALVVPLVGDSHTLTGGWVDAGNWTPRPVYLPGIQMRHLADPKPNVFKSGLQNACIMSSRNKDVIFMIGEIDYRITESRRLGSSQIFEDEEDEIIKVQKQVAADAISFIASQKAADQKYSVCSVQPANPILFKKSNPPIKSASFEVRLIEEVNASIESKCREHGVYFIDRREYLSAHDGFLREDALLDGKHLKRKEHQRIFSALT